MAVEPLAKCVKSPGSDFAKVLLSLWRNRHTMNLRIYRMSAPAGSEGRLTGGFAWQRTGR